MLPSLKPIHILKPQTSALSYVGYVYDQSNSAGINTITIPSSAKPGDIAIWVDSVWAGSTSPVFSDALPSGFTADSFINTHMHGRICSKILEYSDINTSKTGLGFTGTGLPWRWAVCSIYRPNFSINGLISRYQGAFTGTSAPPSQTVPFASYSTKNLLSVIWRSQSTAQSFTASGYTSIVSISSVESMYKIVNQGTAQSNVSVSVTAAGRNLFMTSLYEIY